MTSMIAATEVLKQDARGRVRVPVERREALLEEFDRSGLSGAAFARLAGIKYATFACWVSKRRKRRAVANASGASATEVREPAMTPMTCGSVRLFEALVEGNHGVSRSSSGADGLWIELPGGGRMCVESPVQLQMAAELLALLAQRSRARC
jgi:hypothetical protein